MGAKGSKSRSPDAAECLSPLAPLNNASYWEAEEDPEWDNCVMVVATRNDPLHDDPFLHKDVTYPAVNVSRRSSGEDTATGWHACFKNNNYVFVRNGHTSCRHQMPNESKKNPEKWHSLPKSPNDVTFVISTTNRISGAEKGGAVVTLKKPRPRRRAPSPPVPRRIEGETPGSVRSKMAPINVENQVKSTPSEPSTTKKSSSNWLKRFKGSSIKRMMTRTTPEDRTPIYTSTPSTDEGPSTSTPKEEFRDKNVPGLDVTPRQTARQSVRRRLPYSDMSSERTRLDLFDVSPLRSPIPCPNFTNDASFCERPELCDHIRQDIFGAKEDKPSNLEQSSTSNVAETPKQSIEMDLPPLVSKQNAPLVDITESSDPFSNDRNPSTPDNWTLKSLSPSKPSLTPSRESCSTWDEAQADRHPPSPKRTLTRDSNRKSCLSRPLSEYRTVQEFREKRMEHCRRNHSLSVRKSLPEVCLVDISTNDIDRSRLSTSEPALVSEATGSPMEREENESLNRDSMGHSISFTSPQGSSSEEEGPVSMWLKEIRSSTDSECLNALQAKQLAEDSWIKDVIRVGNSQEVCEKIWDLSRSLKQSLEEMEKSTVTVQRHVKAAKVCSEVINVMRWDAAGNHLKQLDSRSLEKNCAEFLEAAKKDDNDSCKAAAENLREEVRRIIDRILLHNLQVIVEILDEPSNTNCLKRALFALVLLGRLDPTLCKLMVKLGAVRSLLSVCVEPKWKSHHPCALRALTVLCAVPQAIKSLEQNDGIECLCDLLCDESAEENIRSEAAGLVAQATAPWTEGSGFILPSIEKNAHRLVASIAGLASKTKSSEVFLLSCAALANLSFVEPVLMQMKGKNLLETLVESCRNGAQHAASLFIKDQVATVLANMAAKEEYRKELSSGHSLVLLMCFLQLRPSVAHSAAQLSACERIQQKAAIAIARLCSDANTSNIVADMRGIQRLVKLCKDRKERNNSDSVLVACLAALRKIASVRQKEEFLKLGAQELVEPRLWDAFLAHSSKQESYV